MLHKFKPSFIVLKWATVDPYAMSKSSPHTVTSILDGKPLSSDKAVTIVNPLNGE